MARRRSGVCSGARSSPATSSSRPWPAILSGEATDAQIAGFAVGAPREGRDRRRAGGAGSHDARVTPSASTSPESTGPLIDTCGTGGDRAGTVNVSTMAATGRRRGRRACREARRARGVVEMWFGRRARGARCGDRPRTRRRRAERPRGRHRLLLRPALPLRPCASPRRCDASSARPPRSTSLGAAREPCGGQAPDRGRVGPDDGGAPDRDARRARGGAGARVLRPRRARRAHRHRPSPPSTSCATARSRCTTLDPLDLGIPRADHGALGGRRRRRQRRRRAPDLRRRDRRRSATSSR